MSADGLIKSSIFGDKNKDGLLVNKKNGGRPVTYIDWLNKDAVTAWKGLLGEYFSLVAPFDGLWTTENEPFGEVNGEVNFVTQEEYPVERESRIL